MDISIATTGSGYVGAVAERAWEVRILSVMPAEKVREYGTVFFFCTFDCIERA